MQSVKIVFMGSPEFAVASLRQIHEVYPVCAAVTIPDKAQGRGRRTVPSPVKQAALEYGIPHILQPASLRDEYFREELAALQPDIIAVVAFRILPRSVYSLARLGAFNIHGSLLPKYRGAAPINWAIINGERETGVTAFLLADKVDTGAILEYRRMHIEDGMTAGDLHDAMMPLAAQLALDTCRNLIAGTIKPVLQDDSQACAAPKLFREDCRIEWQQSAHNVRNRIHGLSPIPGAFSLLEGSPLKIYRADLDFSDQLAAGEFDFSRNALRVGCGEGNLALREVQAQGKRRMNAGDFLRGYRGPDKGRLG